MGDVRRRDQHIFQKGAMRPKRYSRVLATACSLLLYTSDAFAQYYQYADEPTQQSHFFKLLTGPFGSLVMIFMGLGGGISILLTRGGGRKQGVPLLGVGMLVLAIGLFAVRVGISAGVFGHEYIEW